MSKVDCSKVFVTTSSFSRPGNIFDGAFAKVSIKKGELVEKGIVRLLSDNNHPFFNGMNNPHVFTWSDDIPNYTWAIGSGCSTFYNTCLGKNANTEMIRNFKEKSFEIIAKRDIKKGEELTHEYKSLKWRNVFKDLNSVLMNE